MTCRAVIVGAAGVFGRRVARELSEAGIPGLELVLAGRTAASLEALRAELGQGRVEIADASDDGACTRLLDGARVAVLCAGPFQRVPPVLAKACARAGVAYVDISDSRAFTATVRQLSPAFEARGVPVTSAASSFAAVSGALVAEVAGRLERVTALHLALFVGNDNAKSVSAAESVLALGTRPVRAVRGGKEVELPALEGPVPLEFPFGEKGAYRIDAPDYDLWAARIPGVEVDVRFAVEREAAVRGIRAAIRLGLARGATARLLGKVGTVLAGRAGTSGGAVRAEVIGFAEGRPVRAVGFAWAPEDGQRIASRPASILAEAILRGQRLPAGFSPPFELLGPGALLRALEQRGIRVERPQVLPA